MDTNKYGITVDKSKAYLTFDRSYKVSFARSMFNKKHIIKNDNK